MTEAETRDAAALMPMRLTLLLFATITFILFNAGTRWVILTDLERDALSTTQTWATKGLLHSVQADLAQLESGQRGYLLTGDAAYIAGFDAVEARIERALDQLGLLTRGEHVQDRSLGELGALSTQKRQELRRTIALFQQGRGTEALELVNSDLGRRLMDRAYQLISTMIAEERSTLVAQNGDVLRQFRTATYLSVVIGVMTLVALLTFYHHLQANLRKRLAIERELRDTNDTLETRIVARTQQLAHLSRYLIQLAENEKAALARELHDELGASLTAINLDVTAVATRIRHAEPALATKLERALKILHDTVDLKRRIIHNLRPSMLDSLGLPAAMRMHCEDFVRRTGVACEADAPEELEDIDPAWNIALFRVAQEALNNVAKYAEARQVRVILRREDAGVRLRIADDGIGIEPGAIDKPMSHGLLGMRERIAQLGGVFAVRPGDAGRGTIVEAFVPFPGTVPAP